jgi:hypothetical protein
MKDVYVKRSGRVGRFGSWATRLEIWKRMINAIVFPSYEGKYEEKRTWTISVGG